jgi:hypothetical protein
LQTASADLSISNSSIPGISNIEVPSDPAIDSYFIVMHSMSSYAAFLRNATLLELTCVEDIGFHIAVLTDNLPKSISPTLQQQLVPHRSYIDMLPWSSLRDRILNSASAINELEFVLDMASGELKVWGSIPWDPMAWEVGTEFAKKWWFLMDDEILRTTNFWRGQRGDEPLALPQS